MDLACQYGWLELCKYLNDKQIYCSSSIYHAMANNHIDVLKYLISIGHHVSIEGKEFRRAIKKIVRSGNVKTLEFLRENFNLELKKIIKKIYNIDFLCVNGHLEMIKFIRSQDIKIGFDNLNGTIIHIVATGNISILEFTMSIEQINMMYLIEICSRYTSGKIFRYLMSKIFKQREMIDFIDLNNLHRIKCIDAIKLLVSTDTIKKTLDKFIIMSNVVSSGHINTIKYLITKNFKVDGKHTLLALDNNQYKTVEYLLSLGYNFKEQFFERLQCNPPKLTKNNYGYLSEYLEQLTKYINSIKKVAKLIKILYYKKKFDLAHKVLEIYDKYYEKQKDGKNLNEDIIASINKINRMRQNFISNLMNDKKKDILVICY